MSNRFKGKAIYEKKMEVLRQTYQEWRYNQKQNNKPFFIIYTDFKETHLKDISGGSLKLYIYLGFHVNTFTGECWHSVDSIADYFGNDKRTVKKWFKELEDRKLITRIQTGYKRVANTFMLPYGEDEEIDK